jgi:hypothetical protein
MPQWDVPSVSQKSLNLCWEACGRMLWHWRYTNDAGARGGYARRAGAYATLDEGLTEQEMDRFYGSLDIRSLPKPGGRNVRYALNWSPVIVTSSDQVRGHAMVVAGHGSGRYTVINPCGLQVVDFDSPGGDSCAVSNTQMSQAEIDGTLGGRIWYW